MKLRHQPTAAEPFLGKHPGETLQFYYRQHWMRLVRMAQLFLVGTTLYVLAFWLVSDLPRDDTRTLMLIVASWAFALLQLLVLARLYRYFLYVIIVTDQKIYRIKKTLVAVDDRQTIDLWNLSDVTMQQHGLFQNLFGFGTLVLHGNNEDLKIHFTPRIREKLHRISMLRADARRRTIMAEPRFGQTA